MLAYSSVEHMGILVLGIGIGGTAAVFALFHLAANALVKGVLFLSAGNIHRSYASQAAALRHRAPSAARRSRAGCFLLGFLAITGTPPFAPFISEFNIAAAALWPGLHLAGGALPGPAGRHLPGDERHRGQGGLRHPRSRNGCAPPTRTPSATTAPLIMALVLVLVLGLWLPRPPETHAAERRAPGGGQAMSRAALRPLPERAGAASGRGAGALPRRIPRRDHPGLSREASAWPAFAPTRSCASSRCWPRMPPAASGSRAPSSMSPATPRSRPECPQAHLFEREMAEQFGILPEGHPWFKPVRFHASWAAGRDAWDRTGPIDPAVTDFYRVEGEEVHEVAVGPGARRRHRARPLPLPVPRRDGLPPGDRPGLPAPRHRAGPAGRAPSAQPEARGDRRRRHHHRPRLGLLPGPRGPGRTARCPPAPSGSAASPWNWSGSPTTPAIWAPWPGTWASCPPSSFCGRIRGDWLNMTAELCGSRLGRDWLRPGGLGMDLEPEVARGRCSRRLAQDLGGYARTPWSCSGTPPPC